MLEVNVAASVNPIRPYFAGAILRLKEPLTEGAYKSFIDLQDKLHANLCRNRKFVAIGTHDLDTITAPFRCVRASCASMDFTRRARLLNLTAPCLFFRPDTRPSPQRTSSSPL
jgi:phenylalanyl-tRNA synthetase beta subunit